MYSGNMRMPRDLKVQEPSADINSPADEDSKLPSGSSDKASPFKTLHRGDTKLLDNQDENVYGGDYDLELDRGLFNCDLGEKDEVDTEDEALFSADAGEDLFSCKISSSIWEDEDIDIGEDDRTEFDRNGYASTSEMGDQERSSVYIRNNCLVSHPLACKPRNTISGALTKYKSSDSNNLDTIRSRHTSTNLVVDRNEPLIEDIVDVKTDTDNARLQRIEEFMYMPLIPKTTNILDIIESASRNHEKLHLYMKEKMGPFLAPTSKSSSKTYETQPYLKSTRDIPSQKDKSKLHTSSLKERLGLRRGILRTLLGSKLDDIKQPQKNKTDNDVVRIKPSSIILTPENYDVSENNTTVELIDKYDSQSLSYEMASCWKDTVEPSFYSRVSHDERTRQEVIFEIIKSEFNYFEGLTSAIQVFEYPIKEMTYRKRHETDKTDNALETLLNIFNDFRTMTDISKELLSYLTDPGVRRGRVVVCAGIPFLRVLPKMSEVYVSYVKKQAMYKYIIKRIESNYSNFNKIIADCERDKRLKRLTLANYVYMPSSHMGRYKLFLSKLLEKTKFSEQEFLNIQNALDNVCSLLSNMDYTIMKSLQAPKLRTLRDCLMRVYGDNYLTKMIQRTTPSLLLAEGPLIYCINKSSLIPVEAYLTSNFLIVARRPLKPSSANPPLIIIPCGLINSIITSKLAKDCLTALVVHKTPSLRRTPERSSSNQLSKLNSSCSKHSLYSSYSTEISNRDDSKEDALYFTIKTAKNNMKTLVFKAINSNDFNIWILEIEKLISKRESLPKPLACRKVTLLPFGSINCVMTAVYYKNFLLVGTKRGLFISKHGLDSIPTDKSGRAMVLTPFEIDGLYDNPWKVLEKIDVVSRIFPLPSCNALIFMSRKGLWTCPLDMVIEAKYNKPIETKYCQRLITNLDSVYMDLYGDTKLLIVVKKQTYSSILRIYTPLAASNFVQPRDEQGYVVPYKVIHLSIIRKLYTPGRVTKVRIIGDGLVIHSDSAKSVEIIDINTTRVREYPLHIDRYMNKLHDDNNTKAVEIVEIDNNFTVLCYPDFGVLFNSEERRIQDREPIYWLGKPTDFTRIICSDGIYLVAFSTNLVEVWDLTIGSILQTFPTQNIKFISTFPSDLIFTVDQGQANSFQTIYTIAEVDPHK